MSKSNGSKYSKSKPKMDVDGDDEEKKSAEPEVSISFLDVNNMELVLSDFKVKLIGRAHIEQYTQMISKNNRYDDSVKVNASKLMNCITKYYKAYRLPIYIQNVFVLEIQLIQEKKNTQMMIEDVNIFEWNEYQSKRMNLEKNQNIVQLSKHCLYQKLTTNIRAFHKQIQRKIMKRKDWKINPTILILHRIIIWLNQYHDIYDKPCTGCNQLLSYDSDQYGLLLPTIRVIHENVTKAYHIGCIPLIMPSS